MSLPSTRAATAMSAAAMTTTAMAATAMALRQQPQNLHPKTVEIDHCYRGVNFESTPGHQATNVVRQHRQRDTVEAAGGGLADPAIRFT
mmetsp:Transcript_36617/g.91228  ORF Transcript_36617/g.91228 Transcript_36617/m.91228 type:complete len:89 (+) Transcript_36617:623-889(+)